MFDSFLKIDNKMPTKLREHFLNLESHMVRYLCWVEGSSIVKVLKDFQKPNQPNTMLSLDELESQECQ